MFDLFSSNCWRRLCGLSLFSSSWLLWGWTTRLMSNMNVSILLCFVPVKREKTHFRCGVVMCLHNAAFILFCGSGKLNGFHVLHAKQLLQCNLCILIELHNLNTWCTWGENACFVSLHVFLWCIFIRCVKLAGCLWVHSDNWSNLSSHVMCIKIGWCYQEHVGI